MYHTQLLPSRRPFAADRFMAVRAEAARIATEVTWKQLPSRHKHVDQLQEIGISNPALSGIGTGCNSPTLYCKEAGRRCQPCVHMGASIRAYQLPEVSLGQTTINRSISTKQTIEENSMSFSTLSCTTTCTVSHHVTPTTAGEMATSASSAQAAMMAAMRRQRLRIIRFEQRMMEHAWVGCSCLRKGQPNRHALCSSAKRLHDCGP